MLRMARHVARADRHEEPRAWPAAWRSTAWPTAAPARGAVRRHLDPAGGGRRRRRARRGAVRLAPAARTSRARRPARQPAGLAARARVLATTRSRRSSTQSARVYRRTTPTRTSCATRVAELLADEKVVGWFQGRMEFGPRALGARSILGDARIAEDAGDDEPEDQVPRVLPAVRAGRAARATSHEYFEMRAGRGQPVHAAGRAGARASSASPVDGDEQQRSGIEQAQRAALGRPGRSRTSTTRRASRRSTRATTPRYYTAARRVRAADRLPGHRSTPASTCAASRSSARPRTPTAASCAPTWTRWCSRTSCCSRTSSPRPRRSTVDAYLAEFELD